MYNFFSPILISDREKNYREAGLSPLILEHKNERVAFEEYPLQFMLYLLDSIEPVKWFGKNSNNTCNKPAKEVLSHIEMNCKSVEGTYRVTIIWDEEAKAFDGFEKWVEKIKNLQFWMKLDFEERESYITLSFSGWKKRQGRNRRKFK